MPVPMLMEVVLPVVVVVGNGSSSSRSSSNRRRRRSSASGRGSLRLAQASTFYILKLRGTYKLVCIYIYMLHLQPSGSS